jgi:hypothetical protein
LIKSYIAAGGMSNGFTDGFGEVLRPADGGGERGRCGKGEFLRSWKLINHRF